MVYGSRMADQDTATIRALEQVAAAIKDQTRSHARWSERLCGKLDGITRTFEQFFEAAAAAAVAEQAGAFDLNAVAATAGALDDQFDLEALGIDPDQINAELDAEDAARDDNEQGSLGGPPAPPKTTLRAVGGSANAEREA